MSTAGWLGRLIFPLTSLASSRTPRAVWTREQDSYAMLESRAEMEHAFSFLRSRNVGTIYLYADSFRGRTLIAERPVAYRDFIATAHRRGFLVYALLGSTHLQTQRYVLPEWRAEAMAMLQRVLDYNGAVPDVARFDGVNLDIGVHLLEAWEKGRQKLLLDFLDTSAAWMALKRDSGQSLAIGPALPCWFDGIELNWRGRTRPVSEHMADLYDYIALMDYRHTAKGHDGIIAHAAEEMAYGGRVGKKVVIGLELAPNEVENGTFNRLTEADLRRETRLTERAYRRAPAFGGFAFHHYRGYREWTERGVGRQE